MGWWLFPQAGGSPDVRRVVVRPVICPGEHPDGLVAAALLNVALCLLLESGYFRGLLAECQVGEHSSDYREERQHCGGDGSDLGGHQNGHEGSLRRRRVALRRASVPREAVPSGLCIPLC